MWWRCSVLFFIASCFFFFNLGSFLARTDPVQQSDLIISLSGSIPRVQKAVALLEGGLAPKMAVTTGEAYRQVIKSGVNKAVVSKAGQSAGSTYEEGQYVRGLLQSGKYHRVIVVSDGYHLCRVRLTLWWLCHDLGVEFRYTAPERDGAGRWWQSGESRVFVLSELAKIGYYIVWHGLLGQEKDPEWAVAMGGRYNRFLRALVG